MTVRFPEMRTNALSAVAMIANARQPEFWKGERVYSRYPPDLCISILYDDVVVFPTPQRDVGSVIYESEVPLFEKLFSAYDPIVKEYDQYDADGHLRDQRWPLVEQVASELLNAMESNDL